MVLWPPRVQLYTFNQYFFQTKRPENTGVVLVLGSLLEGEMRKVGWGGEHLSLWSWITAGLWPVAHSFPRMALLRSLTESRDESLETVCVCWRDRGTSHAPELTYLQHPQSCTFCQGVSRGSSSLMHSSYKGCQHLWLLLQE